MINLELLRKIRLFQGLETEQLKAISPLLKKEFVPKGHYLVQENTFGEILYILCDGTVKVTKELIKGIDDVGIKEKVLATLTSDILPTFGESGLLVHVVRTANVIAHTDCTVCTLSKSDFNDFAEKNSPAGYLIMKNIACILSERLYETDDNLVKLATAFYIAVQR
jgi:CRP-like cAMP-binding protein